MRINKNKFAVQRKTYIQVKIIARNIKKIEGKLEKFSLETNAPKWKKQYQKRRSNDMCRIYKCILRE